MPASMFAVAVDWYGPSSSLTQARRLGIDNNVEEFLYVGYEVENEERSYVGISKDITSRFRSTHHVFGIWPEETFKLWIGIVASQSEPGRKPSSSPKIHSEALHFAENMTAYFVGTSENRRKSKAPPKRSGFLFNRWRKLEADWPRYLQRPNPYWADFIEYDKEESVGRNVYFGGRVEKFSDL